MAQINVTRMIGTKVLVRKVKGGAGKTSGGLYVPESVNEDLLRGEVVRIDPEGVLINEAKVGDILSVGDLVLARVDYSSSVSVPHNDVGDFCIIDANNILCTFEDS